MFIINKKTILIVMALLMITVLIIGCGKKSKKDDEQPTLTVPNSPSTVKVIAADGQLAMSWEAVSGASMYQIYISEKNDTQFAELAAIATDIRHVLSGLTNDTTYYIWVKAKNSAGASGFSGVASGKPEAAIETPYAPSNFSLVPSSESITVNWEAVSGATSYEIWHGTTDNTNEATKFADVSDALTCEITGLLENKTYWVWLKAKNIVGTSDLSYTQSIITTASGSITGLINSDSGFSVILAENSKTEYYNESAYIAFNNLPAGNYHVKFEKRGYKSIIKEISLLKNQKKDIGTVEFKNLLSDGMGEKIIEHIIYGKGVVATIDWVTKNFNITKTRNTQLTYDMTGLMSTSSFWVVEGVISNNNYPSSRIWLNSYDWTNKHTTGSLTLTLNTGNYSLGILSCTTDSYLKLNYEIDDTGPKIDISELWCNVNDNKQIAINCSDYDTGLNTVRYAITNSLDKPTSFTTIPANTAVQFLDKGIWYLHVEANDNEIPANTSYRVEGPYIIN